MSVKEIIDGLKFTVDMFLFDPNTGETFTEPRNDLDKTTIDACKGAIELLEQTRWIPVSDRLPEESLNSVIGWDAYRERCVFVQYIDGHFQITGSDESFDIVAWMPLPEPYKAESDEE